MIYFITYHDKHYSNRIFAFYKTEEEVNKIIELNPEKGYHLRRMYTKEDLVNLYFYNQQLFVAKPGLDTIITFITNYDDY